MAKMEEKVQKTSKSVEIAKKVAKYWLPVILWAVVIFSFSAKPTTRTSEIYWQDFLVKKSAHVFEYGILTILLFRALKKGGIEKKEAGVYSVILAVLYALSDEFHQSFTPGREPTLRDVFFDTTGSFLAVYIIWRYLPKAPKKLRTLAERLEIV